MSETVLKPLDPSQLVPAMKITRVVDQSGLDALSDFLKRVTVIGLDTETNITNRFYNRRLRTIQIGDRNEQYVIDLAAFCNYDKGMLVAFQGNRGKNAESFAPFQRIVDVIREPLESRNWLKVGMNLEFEYIVLLWCLGIRISNLYGIDLVEKLIHAGETPFFTKGFYALHGIVARYFNQTIDKSQQTTFDLETPLTDEQWLYAALDIRLPLAVKAKQADIVTKANLWKAVEIENNAVPAFGDMHINGVRVDPVKWLKVLNKKKQEHVANVKVLDEYFVPVVGNKIVATPEQLAALEAEIARLKEFSQEEVEIAAQMDQIKGKGSLELKKPLRERRNALLEARKEKRREIESEYKLLKKKTKESEDYEGEAAINYDSPDQLLEALLKIKGFNKNNLKNTNDKTLENLARKGNEVAKAVQNYRSTGKHLKSYGASWITFKKEDGTNKWKEDGYEITAWVDPDTGHIHSSFSQMGAETGRTSSNKPNVQNLPHDPEVRACFVAPPGYKTITMDMSGAELRIIAEMSGARSWITMFQNKEDVHSCSTEILYGEEWRAEAWLDGGILEKGDKKIEIPPCFYFQIKNEALESDEKLKKQIFAAMNIQSPEEWELLPLGKQLKAKCKCPAHKDRRDDTKSANFLLAYKGGPRALAQKIGKSEDICADLMSKHEMAFPDVWEFLKKTGDNAKMRLEARTMSQRRRKFKRPDYNDAKIRALAKLRERGEKDRFPTGPEVSKELAAMYGIIDREGTNMPVQGTNADIAKVAMGAGFCKNGKPFMWWILPKYGALLSDFIHDEFVVWCPEEHVEACVADMSDCIRRAGAEFMKRVVMESEYNVADYWKK